MAKIMVHYAEIGLKGKNRSFFENLLIRNIKLALNPLKTSLFQKQIILEVKPSLINQSLERLTKVFGIAWFSPVIEVSTDFKTIADQSVKLVEDSPSFALRVVRTDKTLSFTSQDVAVKVGDIVRKKTGSKVDLTVPQNTVYIQLHRHFTYLYSQKIPGPGGLPVGSSGKVLCLLSGGFDSIAAAYLLAKRGASVDFLHFHVFADPGKVLTSKIKTIADNLTLLTLSRRLYLASYTPFQMAVFDLFKGQKQELVAFRRLMVKVGEMIAVKNHYQALVLGDSLGQVASQTMENICAVDRAVDIPVFRPLIGMDKKDIISLVKEIGLEQQTNLPYKDCCSLVSRSPATKANLEKIKTIEHNIDLDKITSQINDTISLIKL